VRRVRRRGWPPVPISFCHHVRADRPFHWYDLGIGVLVEVAHRGETAAGGKIRAAPDDLPVGIVDGPARNHLHGALQVYIRDDGNGPVINIAAVVTLALPLEVALVIVHAPAVNDLGKPVVIQIGDGHGIPGVTT